MNKKTNGHDKDEDKVLSFPTLAERDRIRKEKKKQEEEERKARRRYQSASEPAFLNLERILPFTRVMIVSYLIVFLPLELYFDIERKVEAFLTFGFVPGYFTGVTEEFPWYAPLGLFTHVFLHGGWMHLIFNSVMTLVFGIFVEQVIGTRRTFIFYFICAAAGALLHFALDPYSLSPVIGASSAISGLFGAAIIMLYEQGRMGFMRHRGPWPIVGIWVVIMAVIGLLTPGNVAWLAHVGGFLAGAVIYNLLRLRKISF